MSLLQKYRYGKAKRALNKRWKDGSVKALTHVAVPLTRLIPIKNIDVKGNHARDAASTVTFGKVGADDLTDATKYQFTIKPHGDLLLGDGNGKREGEQVTAKTLYLKMTIRAASIYWQTNRPDIGRLLVYIDTQANKSDWSTTSLFGNDGMFPEDSGVNNSIQELQNIDTRKRWIILHDQIIRENDSIAHAMQGGLVTDNDKETKVLALIDLKIPINKKIIYDNDDGAGAGGGDYDLVNKNAIYVTYIYKHDYAEYYNDPNLWKYRLRKIDYHTRLTYVDN